MLAILAAAGLARPVANAHNVLAICCGAAGDVRRIALLSQPPPALTNLLPLSLTLTLHGVSCT